jgi:ABC-type Fe3+-hydroxamate transport system substrate-binding protein
MQITDQLGRILSFKEHPKRIVSLVPSQTELLVDLGLINSIVGITKFCVHPIELRKTKIIVGGTKQVHFSKIEALQPDIILCNKEENTLEMVQELEKIAPVHISDIFTLQDNLQLINQYGELFNVEESARKLEENINFQHQDFLKFVKNKPTIKVGYFIWREPYMVAANNTFIDYLLRLNNFKNCFSNKERYPEVAIEEIILVQPELIMLSSEPYPFKEKHIEELKTQLPTTKVVLVDGEFFSWYGSRLLLAFNYFKKFRMQLS